MAKLGREYKPDFPVNSCNWRLDRAGSPKSTQSKVSGKTKEERIRAKLSQLNIYWNTWYVHTVKGGVPILWIYRPVWAVSVDYKEWELNGSNCSVLHAFRDENLLEGQVVKHWDILKKWKTKASLSCVRKEEEESDRLEEKVLRWGHCMKWVNREGWQLENFITCDRLEDFFSNREMSERRNYEDEDHIFISFTGKKLLRSFSEKEILVGGKALKNKSKVMKMKLGLRVRISIIEASHATELGEETRMTVPRRKSPWSQDFCQKCLVAQSNQQRKYLWERWSWQLWRDSEGRQTLNSIQEHCLF